MGNDIIFVMYYAYYNHKFIIQGSGFGGSHGAGRPLIPFENLV